MIKNMSFLVFTTMYLKLLIISFTLLIKNGGPEVSRDLSKLILLISSRTTNFKSNALFSVIQL